ncbi:MAG: trigger factor [Geobacteraceae bacterium]|nr:trigger factor [Geobacteraceae bacterium]
MLVNVENVSPVKRKITLEIPSERVSREMEKVYGDIRKNASIKGFRKGKVPRPVIEKYYSERIEVDVIKNLVNDSYPKALADTGIVPVSQPQFESDPLKSGEPFKYTVTVEIVPEIELKEYRGLQVEKQVFAPDQAVVEGRIRELQNGMAQLKVVEEDRPAADGDFVVIDFKGFLDGVPFEHGSAVDYVLQLGSKQFVPGFEEQVIGMSRGETREIGVTFPADYGSAELAGKPVTFEVSLKEIKEKELPNLDDDFARMFGPYETMEQLKEKIAEVFASEEKQKITNEVRDRIVKALIEKHDFEVPEALVEKQLSVLVENMKNNLATKNLTLEKIGSSEEQIRTQARSVAISQVKGSLLLAAVADKEGIQIDETFLEEKMRDIAAQANKDFEAIQALYERNPYAKDTLVMQLREDKTIDFLLENAQITEVAAPSEKP